MARQKNYDKIKQRTSIDLTEEEKDHLKSLQKKLGLSSREKLMMYLVEYYEKSHRKTEDTSLETFELYYHNSWPAEGPSLNKKPSRKEIFCKHLDLTYSETFPFTCELLEFMKSEFNVNVRNAEDYLLFHEISLLKDISRDKFFFYEKISIDVDPLKVPNAIYYLRPFILYRIKYVDSFTDVLSFCGHYVHPIILKEIEYTMTCSDSDELLGFHHNW